jgi:hypothetical protein
MRTESLLVFAALTAASSALAAPACTQVTSPNIGTFDNVLAAVSANSASDIWAVGQRAPETNQNQTITLIQHFDGSMWSVVPSPNAGSLANALFSVSANSRSAWAVGYYLQDLATPRSLIEAWNGAAWIDRALGRSHLVGDSASCRRNVFQPPVESFGRL